jgi:transcriptional regulator with XRE-family HTH domain
MTHPAYLREKARDLRTKKKLTIDELADRLALSRSTIYYWVRDVPIPYTRDQALAQQRASRATRSKHRLKREEAYEEGRRTFAQLAEDPTFRDFVNMYIGEGYKRNRNCVALGNSDPAVVGLARYWIKRLGQNKVTYRLQYHADQDPAELCEFWAWILEAPIGSFLLQRKSNSNQLTGRIWRSRFGILTVVCADTLLRARLEAWMDRVKEDWPYTADDGA